MPSAIVDFYRQDKPDSEGRMLREYWAYDDQTMEYRHDFIQWMFPLEEPSAFNPDAPLVTEQDKREFRQDSLLQNSLRRSLARFLVFLGLEMTKDGSVRKGPNFVQRSAVWIAPNHNWLRITRLLRSLRLLGLEVEARQVWKCLQHLHEVERFVSEESFEYWHDAAMLA